MDYPRYTSPAAMSKRDLESSHRPAAYAPYKSKHETVDQLELREEALNKSSLLFMESNRDQILSLKDDYTRSHSTAKALEEQVRHLRLEASTKTEETERLREQIMSVTEKSGRLESEIRIKNMQLEQRREELEKQRRHSAEMLHKERSNIEKLRNELTILERQQRALVQEAEHKEQTIAGLRLDLDRMKETVLAKDRAAASIREDLDRAKTVIDELAERARLVPGLEHRLKEAEELCVDRAALHRRVTEEERAKADIFADLRRSRDENSELLAVQQQLADTVRSLKSRINALEQAQVTLERIGADQVARNRALDEEVTRTRRANEEHADANRVLMQTAEATKNRAVMLEAELNTAERCLADLRRETAGLEESQEQAVTAMCDAASLLRTTPSKAGSPWDFGSKGSAASSRTQSAGLDKSPAAMQNAISALLQAADNARTRLASLQEELVSGRAAILRGTSDCAELREELENEHDGRIRAEDRVGQQAAQMEVERDHSKALERSLTAAGEELEQLRLQLKAKIEGVARLGEEKAEVQLALARTNMALNERQDEVITLRRNLDGSVATAERLQRDLAAARNDLERERVQAVQLVDRGRAKEEEVAIKERELRELRSSEADLRQRVARLQHEKDVRTTETAELKRRQQQMERDLTDVKGTAEALARVKADKEGEVENMKGELKDMRINLMVERSRLEREKHIREEKARERLSLLDVRMGIEDDFASAITDVSPRLTSQSPAVSNVLQPALSRVGFASSFGASSSFGHTQSPGKMISSPSEVSRAVREMGAQELRTYLDFIDQGISAGLSTRIGQSFRRD